MEHAPPPPEVPPEVSPEVPPAFPDHQSLCERCGYRLVGLTPDAACPECGLPVDDSDPRHRTGPAWQHRLTPGNYLGVWAGIHRSPWRFFRTMTLAGSNLPPRLVLLSMVWIVCVGWAGFEGLAMGRPGLSAWGRGMVAGLVVLTMSYVEVLGVTAFSRRRGWRMPMGLAERIVGYASVGWVYIAGLAMGVRAGFRMPPRGWWVSWAGDQATAAALIAGVLAMMFCLVPFESLVWLGVRQANHANPPSPAARGTRGPRENPQASSEQPGA